MSPSEVKWLICVVISTIFNSYWGHISVTVPGDVSERYLG